MTKGTNKGKRFANFPWQKMRQNRLKSIGLETETHAKCRGKRAQERNKICVEAGRLLAPMAFWPMLRLTVAEKAMS